MSKMAGGAAGTWDAQHLVEGHSAKSTAAFKVKLEPAHQQLSLVLCASTSAMVNSWVEPLPGVAGPLLGEAAEATCGQSEEKLRVACERLSGSPNKATAPLKQGRRTARTRREPLPLTSALPCSSARFIQPPTVGPAMVGCSNCSAKPPAAWLGKGTRWGAVLSRKRRAGALANLSTH